MGTAITLEKKIKEEIEKRIKALDISRKIREVVIPTQKKIVIKNGKQTIKDEMLYPGYVLVNMVMDTDTFALIRNIEGVKGFISTGRKPKPLSKVEVENMMKFKENKKATYQKTFQSGDAVKITSGAFADFVGTIKDVNAEKGMAKVLVTIFGRETPVELNFDDIKKL